MRFLTAVTVISPPNAAAISAYGMAMFCSWRMRRRIRKISLSAFWFQRILEDEFLVKLNEMETGDDFESCTVLSVAVGIYEVTETAQSTSYSCLDVN